MSNNRHFTHRQAGMPHPLPVPQIPPPAKPRLGPQQTAQVIPGNHGRKAQDDRQGNIGAGKAEGPVLHQHQGLQTETRKRREPAADADHDELPGGLPRRPVTVMGGYNRKKADHETACDIDRNRPPGQIHRPEARRRHSTPMPGHPAKCAAECNPKIGPHAIPFATRRQA